MTIHHKPHAAVLSDFEAIRRVITIIDANPAIKNSIQELVDHDMTNDSVGEKRNRSVFAVYIKNAVFGDAVDAELDRV